MSAPAGLRGKVAFVTGAGGGLGKATALGLAAAGCDVGLLDLTVDAVAPIADECRSLGVRAAAAEVDQTDALEVADAIGNLSEELGRPADLLFANAGVGQFAPFLDTTPDDWFRTVDTNLNGTFYVCQAVARAMVEQGSGGSIVLTASSGATVVCDHLSAYCASKAGVVMLARHMASELGSARIRVNAVLPGVIETGMTAPMLSRSRWQNMVANETPVGRHGTPQDVANLVLFLLSEDAGYINGEGIMIDGGSTLHAYPRWYAQSYADDEPADWSNAFGSYPYTSPAGAPAPKGA